VTEGARDVSPNGRQNAPNGEPRMVFSRQL
jgi:hypothetical protein